MDQEEDGIEATEQGLNGENAGVEAGVEAVENAGVEAGVEAVENAGVEAVENAEVETVEVPPRVIPAGVRRRGIMAQYLCNQCRKYARGAVITICGHVFCWACLWPQLADKAHPRCPRCRGHLLLENDIVPMYGSPDDGDNVAAPGAVPRPAGIYLEPEEPVFLSDLLQRLEPFHVELRVEETFPRISRLLTRIHWLQVACAVLIALIWYFIPPI